MALVAVGSEGFGCSWARRCGCVARGVPQSSAQAVPLRYSFSPRAVESRSGRPVHGRPLRRMLRWRVVLGCWYVGLRGDLGADGLVHEGGKLLELGCKGASSLVHFHPKRNA